MHSPCCTSSPRRSASLASTSTRVGSPNTRWRCERRQDSHHGSRGVERVPTAPRTSRLPADDRAAEPLALVLDLARTERVSATQVLEKLLGVEVTMASRMLTIKRAARKRSDRLRPIDAYRCRRDFNGFHHACSRRHSNPIRHETTISELDSAPRNKYWPGGPGVAGSSPVSPIVPPLGSSGFQPWRSPRAGDVGGVRGRYRVPLLLVGTTSVTRFLNNAGARVGSGSQTLEDRILWRVTSLPSADHRCHCSLCEKNRV